MHALLTLRLVAVAAALVVFSTTFPSWADQSCRTAELALQVLGSGGPIADDDRSSSGYLLWVDGRAILMVDAGSGTFTRFGQAGATFDDLDLIALSHFHTDHSAALPALLKSGYFSSRSRPLRIVGPSAGGPFPSLDEFLVRLLDPKVGAFSYLSGYLEGTGGLVQLQPMTVGPDQRHLTRVYEGEIVTVDALPVPHGIVPSLAYVIQAAGRTIVLGSDQNGSNPMFTAASKDVDLLVLHAVIPDGANAAARALHATPTQLAAIVQAANPAQVVLSHWMARSLGVRNDILETMRGSYAGPVTAAEDLACFPLSRKPDVQ